MNIPNNKSEKLTTKHISSGNTAADQQANSQLISSVLYQHLKCRIVRKYVKGRAKWPVELIGAVGA